MNDRRFVAPASAGEASASSADHCCSWTVGAPWRRVSRCSCRGRRKGGTRWCFRGRRQTRQRAPRGSSRSRRRVRRDTATRFGFLIRHARSSGQWERSVHTLDNVAALSAAGVVEVGGGPVVVVVGGAELVEVAGAAVGMLESAPLSDALATSSSSAHGPTGVRVKSPSLPSVTSYIEDSLRS